MQLVKFFIFIFFISFLMSSSHLFLVFLMVLLISVSIYILFLTISLLPFDVNGQTKSTLVILSSLLYSYVLLIYQNHNFFDSTRTVSFFSRTKDLSCWGFFPWLRRQNMCPGDDSASENEYQGFLLE